ncbi:CamS family sex pheromone protein [Aquibacillus sp. 3ASR75-11]|uniref:CamS family sex pheromone protein n=1 Tax=Terrihalobacillus insolitus TaxID=2950438 RepID=A0A9X4APB9_9BACI|nr:CamS family sex pheromone protein [Terrihalobacillus insolitus]MDC3414187.1 CamS family sex pheromone protein [Terrihalobacillus insolitus]MDC3425393.1 CamS family sex pheromone protein [Terrihalobacillus insolitus]
MKKISVLIIMLLVISACAPSYDKQEEVVEETKDDTQQQTAIVPSYNISNENYKVLLPYEPSEARGIIVNQMANRLDIDEFEEGLRRQSKEIFKPSNYYFQEGQYLGEDTVLNWLGRTMTDKQVDDYLSENKDLYKNDAEKQELKESLQIGLNPPIAEDELKEEDFRESPKYLSHILEQNFLKKGANDAVKLGGISIGLAMKSTYRFQTEIGGPYYYEDIPKADMLTEGKKIAEKIVDRLRQMDNLGDVPIMIGLYREEEQSAIVPGNFVAKTTVAGDKNSIGEWEPINEEYVLYPSNELKDKYFDDNESLKEFEQQVRKYFPNYVGVIGKAFYVNGNLQRLTIDLPIEFYGKAEVIGFTQYVYGLVMETFKNYFDLEVNIMSNDKQEALIVRKAGESEPYVYVYDQ